MIMKPRRDKNTGSCYYRLAWRGKKMVCVIGMKLELRQGRGANGRAPWVSRWRNGAVAKPWPSTLSRENIFYLISHSSCSLMASWVLLVTKSSQQPRAGELGHAQQPGGRLRPQDAVPTTGEMEPRRAEGESSAWRFITIQMMRDRNLQLFLTKELVGALCRYSPPLNFSFPDSEGSLLGF